MISARKAANSRNACLLVCTAELLIFVVLRHEQFRRDLIGSDIAVFDTYSTWTWASLAFTVASIFVVWRLKLAPWAIQLLLIGNVLHLMWLVIQLWWALPFIF